MPTSAAELMFIKGGSRFPGDAAGGDGLSGGYTYDGVTKLELAAVACSFFAPQANMHPRCS